MKNVLNRLNVGLVVLYAVMVLPLWGALWTGKPSSMPVFSAVSRGIDAQRQDVREQAKIQLLNLLMPSQYGDLAELSRSKVDPKSVDLEKYAQYYIEAAGALPPPMSADAHALAGFCRYHQGRTKEAQEHYAKSLEENPVFIWTYNNLAFLRFKEGDYPTAAALLGRSLQVKPEMSVRTVVSSKIYTDIVKDAKGGVDWPSELKTAYSEAARMLVLSFYKLGRFKETAEAAQYAVNSGFEPSAFFYYYTGRALEAAGDPSKAKEFLSMAGDVPPEILSGEDLSVRIF